VLGWFQEREIQMFQMITVSATDGVDVEMDIQYFLTLDNLCQDFLCGPFAKMMFEKLDHDRGSDLLAWQRMEKLMS
jgi:hypothetical protein